MKISVFPDSSDGKPIKRDKLEEFLKSVKSNAIVQYISDKADLSRMIMTLGTVCQKLFNELEELKEKSGKIEKKESEELVEKEAKEARKLQKEKQELKRKEMELRKEEEERQEYERLRKKYGGILK